MIESINIEINKELKFKLTIDEARRLKDSLDMIFGDKGAYPYYIPFYPIYPSPYVVTYEPY